MANNDFDDQIRDALGDFKANYDDNSWDMLMGKMMVDPELSGELEQIEEFDQAVKSQLDKVENPKPTAASWDVMAERIKQEFSLRRRLLRYKVAEIALVLLAIFTLVNHFPNQVNGSFKNIKEKIANKKHALAEYRDAFFLKKKEQHVENSTTERLIVENTAKKEIREKKNTEITPVVKSTSEVVFNQTSITQQEVALIDPPQEFAIAEITAVAPEEEFDSRKLLAEINSLDNDPLSEINFEKKKFKGKSLVAKIFSPIKQVRVSMFAGSDFNYIETPYDEIFELEQYSRLSEGYQAGVTIGFKNKNVEVVTGGIYARKDYEPRIPTEYLNSLPGPPIAVKFDRIQLNMLEIPLNFRYSYLNKTRWKFYAQTGTSMHIALLADYDRSNISDLFMFASPGEPAPKLEEKEFKDGLLEGGSFEENSYFTANLGLGAEYLLNPRWSIFMQPSVKAYMLPGFNNGLGPNQDRISSFSLVTGARVTFGNK